ncbi:MAG: phenylalanine--tRNA ligase subunit alpha [Candidatus Hodarchaeales archaeon]
MTTDPLSISQEMNQLLGALIETKRKTLNELAEILQMPRGKVELLMFQLLAKDLVTKKSRFITRFDLTDEGTRVLDSGLPENQLLKFLTKTGQIPLVKIAQELDIPKQAVNAAIGQLRKNQIITIDKGVVSLVKSEEMVNKSLEKALADIKKDSFTSIPEKIVNELSRRKLAEKKDRTQTFVNITSTGKTAYSNVKIVESVSKLTPDNIRSGDWRSLQLKKYKISAKPKSLPIGRKHPYLIFQHEVKEKLLGLGFSEMRGPLVELEFWNFDALFQAQDHPAREWSDVYTIKSPSHGKLPEDKKIVEGVKRVHETGEPVGSRGWRYKWDPKKAAQLLLRPQGTAVSARTLYNLKIPSKYFSIARCYRPDSVDVTHLSEFNQMEGIVCDPSITFRDLLGILQSFAIEVAGATEVRFKPDFYPFTSPSVELSALHPKLGYIEFGGAGIFRPEVNAPFNIKYPVIAWGLGIDRLYMVKRGINDIRELFTQKLDWLREVPVV